MTEVDKIYPQFYSLLKEAFPNLTESEYQYCYLHIFGFDANDEAKLLGINPASVRMKRTRIYQEVKTAMSKPSSTNYPIGFLFRIFISSPVRVKFTGCDGLYIEKIYSHSSDILEQKFF